MNKSLTFGVGRLVVSCMAKVTLLAMRKSEYGGISKTYRDRPLAKVVISRG